jgi:hypothetical protein
LRTLAKRGDGAWRDVEELIALRNAPSYDRAAALLADLKEIATAARRPDEFERRLADIGAEAPVHWAPDESRHPPGLT